MAIYKTRNTRTGNGTRGKRGARRMFTRNPENVVISLFRGMLKKIPGNVQEDSGEFLRRVRGIIEKIPANDPEESGECLKRCFFEHSPESLGIFPEIFFTIPRNLLEHSSESSSTFPGMLK